MQATARFVLWIGLGGWIGAWVLFAAVVAPVAFRALPSPEMAGRVVGPVLSVLHVYGIVAGLGLAALAALLRRGPLAIALPLVLAALCAVSELGVTPAIQEIRPRAFGAAGDTAAAARFAWLHRVSVGLYTAVGLGALGLAAAHARRDARPPEKATTPRQTGDFS